MSQQKDEEAKLLKSVLEATEARSQALRVVADALKLQQYGPIRQAIIKAFHGCEEMISENYYSLQLPIFRSTLRDLGILMNQQVYLHVKGDEPVCQMMDVHYTESEKIGCVFVGKLQSQ